MPAHRIVPISVTAPAPRSRTDPGCIVLVVVGIVLVLVPIVVAIGYGVRYALRTRKAMTVLVRHDEAIGQGDVDSCRGESTETTIPSPELALSDSIEARTVGDGGVTLSVGVAGNQGDVLLADVLVLGLAGETLYEGTRFPLSRGGAQGWEGEIPGPLAGQPREIWITVTDPASGARGTRRYPLPAPSR